MATLQADGMTESKGGDDGSTVSDALYAQACEGAWAPIMTLRSRVSACMKHQGEVNDSLAQAWTKWQAAVNPGSRDNDGTARVDALRQVEANIDSFEALLARARALLHSLAQRHVAATALVAGVEASVTESGAEVARARAEFEAASIREV